MIHHDFKFYEMIISCDFTDCDFTQEYEGDFKECIAKSKKDGWRHFKENDGFVNQCKKHYRERHGFE